MQRTWNLAEEKGITKENWKLKKSEKEVKIDGKREGKKIYKNFFQNQNNGL